MEPQYLAVSKAPLGLKYLENVKVDDIHYKVCTYSLLILHWCTKLLMLHL